MTTVHTNKSIKAVSGFMRWADRTVHKSKWFNDICYIGGVWVVSVGGSPFDDSHETPFLYDIYGHTGGVAETKGVSAITYIAL